MKINSIKPLGHDLRRRLSAPCGSVTFYYHLVIAVIIGGGLGFWYEVIFNGIIHGQWKLENISAALFAYFPAIVAVAVNDFSQEKQPYLRSFGLFAAGVFAVVFLIAVATDSKCQLIWAAFGALLAILFWWVANGEKECFRDIDPNAATPDPSQPMLGTNKGWQT